MILGPVYMLHLYRQLIFGRLTKVDLAALLDLSPREIAVFVPLAILTLWMGIYPSSFTSFFDTTATAIVDQHVAAVASAMKVAGGSNE